MSPIAVLLVAVLLACSFWLVGVEIRETPALAPLALVVALALAWSWPPLRPAVLCGPALGFAAGAGPLLVRRLR